MRPVIKWMHTDGSIIPPINEFYNPYSSSKFDLERNIDAYCSYCERPAQDEAVHVEHIQPKALPAYAHLEFSWNNFLLSCARCNGSDNKSNKDLILSDIHLPHRNNTFLSIHYREGGLVKVNNTLSGKALRHAVSLIKLVGLHKRPGHRDHLPKDKRWDRRREVWEIAKRNLVKFSQGSIDEHVIMDLAKGYGFWSVWLTVFDMHPTVKKLLIESFRGTALNCFDAANNYQPIPRNPADPVDTI